MIYETLKMSSVFAALIFVIFVVGCSTTSPDGGQFSEPLTILKIRDNSETVNVVGTVLQNTRNGIQVIGEDGSEIHYGTTHVRILSPLEYNGITVTLWADNTNNSYPYGVMRRRIEFRSNRSTIESERE